MSKKYLDLDGLSAYDQKIKEYIDDGDVTIDNTLTQAGQAADAKKTGDELTDLKSAIYTQNTLTGWEKGAYRSDDGTYYANESYIRCPENYISAAYGTAKITTDTGYNFIIYAWDLSGTYIGSYHDGETFTPTAGAAPVTEFDCRDFPTYKFKVAMARDPASTSITPDEGIHLKCADPTDKSLATEGKAADAKKVGDEIADVKSAFDATAYYKEAQGHGGTGITSILEVEDAVARKAKSLVVDLGAVQAGSGDPSPENVREFTGWNQTVICYGKGNLFDLSQRQTGKGIDSNGNIYASPNYQISGNISLNGAKNVRYIYYNSAAGYRTSHINYYRADGSFISKREGSKTASKNYRVESITNIPAETNYYIVEVPNNTTYVAVIADYSVKGYTYESPIYGGKLDVTGGTLTVTHGYIASYDGEELPGKWASSMDVYAEGTTPTAGAQVVYELAAPVVSNVEAMDIVFAEGKNCVMAYAAIPRQNPTELLYPCGTDRDLKADGAPADAKATGETISDLKNVLKATTYLSIRGKIYADNNIAFVDGGITDSGDDYNGDASYNAQTKRSSYFVPECDEDDIIFFESKDIQLLAIRLFIYNDDGFVRETGYQRGRIAVRHIAGYRYRLVYQVKQPDIDSVDIQTVYDNCLIYYKAQPLSKNLLTPVKDTYAIMTYNVGQWYNGSGAAAPITKEINDLRMQFDAIQRQIIDKYTPDVMCIQEYYTNLSLTAKNYNNAKYYNAPSGNLYSAKLITTNYNQSEITGVVYTTQGTSVKTNYAYTYILLNGKSICVIDTHLTLSSTENRVLQMTQLKAFADTQDYVIICGDFNANIHNPDVYTAVYKPWEDDGYHLINTPDFGKRLQDGTLQALDNVITSSNIDIKYGFCDYTKESLPYADRDHMPVIAYVTIN